MLLTLSIVVVVTSTGFVFLKKAIYPSTSSQSFEKILDTQAVEQEKLQTSMNILDPVHHNDNLSYNQDVYQLNSDTLSMPYSTSSAIWNLALPSSLQQNDSILPIIVNQTTFAIPLDNVHYIDYPKSLTFLPFSTIPVEGIISFNGQPLLQLNVAQALNIKNNSEGKIVIVNLLQEKIALRVEEVLSFISPQEESNNKHNKDLPLLKLDEVFPWLREIIQKHKKTTKEETEFPIETMIQNKVKQREENNEPETNLSCYILLVSSGGKTIGLLADTIERIEQIDEVLPVRDIEDSGDFVVRIENNLFPARSLSHFIHADACVEKQALIFYEGGKIFVLAVEHISSLEKVAHFHLTFHFYSGKNRLWYLNEENMSIEVMSIRECFGKTDNYESFKITDPRLQWDNTPQLAAKLSTEGVRIQCAEASFVLPLQLVNRILGDLLTLNQNLSQDSKDQVIEGKQTADKIPVIDCVKLIYPERNLSANTYLLLSLSCGYVVIGVNRTTLQPTLSSQQWSLLKLLPPPSSLFFDAATFDETEKKWVLRVKTEIDFSQFPWKIKRLLVSSLMGWIETTALESNDL